jgi:hypothetical protein
MTTNKETKKVNTKMFSAISKNAELIKPLMLLTAYDYIQVLYPKPIPGIIHCGSPTNVTE